MEWNLNIPKILHLYWGGRSMSYFRYLTIETFIRHNPDWRIILWYPKYPSTNITWKGREQKYMANYEDFFPKVLKFSPITKIEVDFQDYGIDNKMSEVHKSDFLRILKLSTFGGVWSDMDIFYLKPMNSLYFNTMEDKNIETVYCNNLKLKYGHSVGFLMASHENIFFKNLLELSKNVFNPYDYQCLGVSLFNQYFSTPESISAITPAVNMLMDVVYPYDATQVRDLLSLNKTRFPVKAKITDNTIGIHWYAGSILWKEFMARTNGGLTNLPNNVIGNILKNENTRVKDNIS